MPLGLYRDADDPIYQTSQQARTDLPVYHGLNQDDRPPPPAAPTAYAPPQPAAAPAAPATQPTPDPMAGYGAPIRAENPEVAGKLVDQGMIKAGYGQPIFAETAEEAPKGSNFVRGLQTSWEQMKQTGAGAAALVGDTFGLKSLKDWGLEKYQSLDKDVKALGSENDDVFKAMSKDGSFSDWLGYAAGYTLGQAGQMLVGGGVGGWIGKALLQKGVQKVAAGMIEKKVGELAAEELIAGGMAEAAAKTKAAEMIAQNAIPEALKNKAVTYAAQMTGAAIAATAMNAQQELGGIYGDAMEQSAQTGVPPSLAKIWAAGIGATALDTFTDMGALGRVLHGAGHGSNLLGRVAKAGTAQALKEAGTEGIQTLMERWGADKSMADVEALHDVINSMAMGAVGGGAAGVAAGATGRSKEAQKQREQGRPGGLQTALDEEDLGTITPGSNRGVGLQMPGPTPPGAPPTGPTSAEQENEARWKARDDAERQRTLYGNLSDQDVASLIGADDASAKIHDASKKDDVKTAKQGVEELVANAQAALDSIGSHPAIYSTLGQAQAALDALAEKQKDKGSKGSKKGKGLQADESTAPAEPAPLAQAALTAPGTTDATVTPTPSLPTDVTTPTTTTPTTTTPITVAPTDTTTDTTAPTVTPTDTTAPGALETPTAPTVPEPAGDIAAQLAAMMDPNNPRKGVFVAEGTPMPQLPAGVAVVTKKGQGTFITTDPTLARSIKGTKHLDDKQIANFLGIPHAKAEIAARTDNPLAITAKDKNGNVVASAATDTTDSPNATAIKDQVPPGGSVVTQTPEQLLAEREAANAEPALETTEQIPNE